MWKKKVISRIANKRYHIAAFLMPVLIMVSAFALIGIYPFGDEQIAVIDMYHQYVPFLSELQSKMQQGESLFFSWNIGGGVNFWCLLAYYCASPLNLLLILFPKKLLMEGVTTILLIKIGMAGSFMYKYLTETQRLDPIITFDRKDLGNAYSSSVIIDDYPGRAGGVKGVVFACMYALCAYVLGYYWCIMWMDAVMLLPLCILGLHRIIEGRSPALYTVSLALVVLSNYYMAIMVCIFILCYYPALYFIKVRGGGIKQCVVTTAKSAGYSILALAMSAVILLPTYLSMGKTYYFDSQMPEDWAKYNSFIDVLRQLLPEYQLTFREGLPNLYCGIVSVIFLVAYAVTKRVSTREKLINLVLMVFLILCLNINKPDFIWHGMHFPNQLPFRWSFAVSFLLVTMAYKGFSSVERMTGKKSQAVALILVALLVAGDCGVGTYKAMSQVGSTTRDDYFAGAKEIHLLEKDEENKSARTEIYGKTTLNNPALFGYKGVSQFSSSADADVSALMESIGLEGADYRNRYNYVLTNPVTNAILGINYLITWEVTLSNEDFNNISRRGDCYLYESKYPMSIGYMTDEKITSWKLDPGDPFSCLNDFAKASVNDKKTELFKDAKNVKITEKKTSTEIKAVSNKHEKYYIFAEPDDAESIELRINGDYYRNITEDCGAIIYGGSIAEGDSISIVINYENADSKDSQPLWRICTMDEKQWNGVYEKLSDELVQVDEFSSRGLTGKIDAKKAGRLLITVPWEKGWTLKIDGKKTAIDKKIGGCWISAPLNKGTHKIELSFTPYGFFVGLAISLSAVAILILLCNFAKVRPGGRRGRQSLSEESDCNKKS